MARRYTTTWQRAADQPNNMPISHWWQLDLSPTSVAYTWHHAEPTAPPDEWNIVLYATAGPDGWFVERWESSGSRRRVSVTRHRGVTFLGRVGDPGEVSDDRDTLVSRGSDTSEGARTRKSHAPGSVALLRSSRRNRRRRN